MPRDLVKVIVCVCLTACLARAGDVPGGVPASAAPEGRVLHLKLSGGVLREQAETPVPASRPVVAEEANRVLAQRKLLAHQITLEIDDLRAKIQALNSKVTARPTPPPERIHGVDGNRRPATPSGVEPRAVRQVAHSEPIVPGDAPTASQREINRLITQSLSELEKEVRELGDRVRAISPPVK